MDATAAKHDLRRRCLATLRAVPMERRERFSALLRAELLARLQAEKPDAAVAIYAPLPHEVDLMPLLAGGTRYRFLFPRCLPGRQMQFRHVTKPGRELVPGAHGIPAPAEECPIVPHADIDVLVVPGVAFTADGRRLGYGGGYYDRAMPLCRKARILALAFPWQIVPQLPTEPHDLGIPELIIANPVA